MRALISVLTGSFAAPVLAHPGDHHASLLASMWHMLTQPDHLAMLAIALVVGIAAAVFSGRRAR